MKNNVHPADLSSRKQRIAQHFAQATRYDHHANIQQLVCNLLLAKIAYSHHDSVLEIGAGTGQMTRLLAENIQSNHWIINELSKRQSAILQSISPSAKIVIGDAETINLGNNYSLVISANAVQWFDNPLDFIEQSYARLESNGQLLFNTFTPNNFSQIKSLTGQGLHYPTVNAWRLALEKSGFEQIELSTHRFDLTFSNPHDVLKHMKLTGVSTNQTATLLNDSPFMWTKSRLQQFGTDYWQQFSARDDNGNLCVNLTYEVLMINAFKP